ncbi:unnamed protein product [Pylaiella littoralis]
MAEVRPDNEEVKTIDLENIGTDPDSLFTSVHGQKLMTQASKKVDELVHKQHPKTTYSTENKGLELTTNARLSRFEAEKIFANGWSNTSLDLLEALFTECKKKTVAYADAARASRKKHRMLSIPSLVIASAATATSFFAAGTECSAESDDSGGLKVAVAMLTSVTAVLAGVAALYSFDSKTTACIAASGNFDSLSKKTQIQIYLTNELRGPVEVVINDVSSEFCHLTNTSPLL